MCNTPNSYSSQARFGWGGDYMIAGGQNRIKDGDWKDWEEEDVAIFKIEKKMLKMYVYRLQRLFTIRLPIDKSWYIYFNIGTSDKVEVSVPTEEDVSFVN